MLPMNLLLKPVSGTCDLNCKYCFYHDEMSHRKKTHLGKMSEKTLENVLQKSLAYASQICTVGFQGGEPTLIGRCFFEKALSLECRNNIHNVEICNTVQTNGYGMTDEWAKFFAENNFLVGISIDGKKAMHDAFRVTEGGKGTFAEVMNAVDIMEKYGVKYNVLTVVNSRTAKQARKIYEFYAKKNFKYLQFIPCLDPLNGHDMHLEYSLQADSYAQFLCELFDCWYEDMMLQKAPYIRMFVNYIGILLGFEPEACDMTGVCGVQNVVEADGTFYPCDFYALDEYSLGNINELSIEEIYLNREKMMFSKKSEEMSSSCHSCKYLFLCRGGCRRYRTEKDEYGRYKNKFCKSYQIFFTYALPRMNDICVRIKRDWENGKEWKMG